MSSAGAPQPPRPAIVRSAGTTPAEQYLAKLAERSFLNLWSYPNPHRDQKLPGGSDGKEICDLLVVCGDHILIFSEKTYSWPKAEPGIAWARWYRKAIRKSVEQIRGAERWIADFPDRIFLDRACTQRLPIDLPPLDRRRVHGIVVAGGAGDACRRHFSGGCGSLAINPAIKGDQHTSSDPFWIGDPDPDGSFIHVLDDGSLDIVLSELDTVTDFTAYLTKKAAFIRSGRLAAAHGEEDLLAYYSIRINSEGAHDFTHPDERPWRAGESVALDGTHYSGLVENPQYAAKQRANRISYAWDALIRNFTKHMMAGTSLAPPWQDHDLRKSELGVREMALASRFERRSHGEAVMGALEAGRGKPIFQRSMIPLAHSRSRRTGFFILTVSYDPRFDDRGGYDEYRLFRAALTELYAKGLLLRYAYLERIVGIAMEPPGDGGSSEDILYAEQSEWTAQEKEEIWENCRQAGIMRPEYREVEYKGQEFPSVPARYYPQYAGMNRQQRRAAMSRGRKRDK